MKLKQSISQRRLVKLISWLCIVVISQWSFAANGASSPGGATNAAEKAQRRIIVRFKQGSQYAGSGNTAQSSNRQSAQATRAMPIQGIRHLKSYRLGRSRAVSQRPTPFATSSDQAVEITVVEMVDPGADRDQLIKALVDSGEVEYAEPDYVMSVNAFPDDTNFASLWSLNNIGQSGGTVDADIDAVEAWNITTGSSSVVVGVVDTGIHYNHPDLIDNMWRNPGETGLDASNADKATNGIDDDLNGYVDDVYGIDCVNNDADPMDDNHFSYHGTHVSGIIGAQGDNGSQVTGVNWDVSIMALKYLGSNGTGVVSDAVECLTYVANMKRDSGINIKVTNNSYGGPGSSQAMQDAIQANLDQDILFVAAAGNDAEDNDVAFQYPASYDLPNIVSVASTDRNNNKAGTSNFGLQTVDIGAPGASILSTVGPSGTGLKSGTSMASPHVAGVAALLAANEPSLGWAQLKGRMLDTAVAIPALDGLTVTGGLVNAFDALNCSSGDNKMYITPIATSGLLKLGETAQVQIQLSECGNAVTSATVIVTPDNGEIPFALNDDGIAPDATLGDGFYTADWTPTLEGEYVLAIEAVTGSTSNGTISIQVVNVPSYNIDPAHPYLWRESSDGTDVGLGNVDDSGTNIAIGFDFDFYGINYSDIWVHSNGMLKFGSDVELSFFEFISLPSNDNPNNFISPLWEDLNPSVNAGAIYSKLEGTAPNRRLIVQWHELLHFRQVSENLPSTVTFQAILYEGSNDIVMQYKDLTFGSTELDFAARAMVGIELFDGNEGVSYLNQGLPADTSLAEQQAILFSLSDTTQRTLIVSPPDDGVVSADHGQINCDSTGAQCFGQYPVNSLITLTATPAPGFRFEDWSGAGCDGEVTNSCSVTLGSHETVTAQFGINPDIVVTPTSGLVTNENGITATFTVALSKTPGSNVTINLTSSDIGEGTVNPSSLVFTPGDGTSAKTVTVTGVDDALDDGNVNYQIITDPAISADQDFSGLDPADISLTNNDDTDTAGITITSSAQLMTTELGGSDSFGVVLNSQPVDPVTIILVSSDLSEGALDKAAVNFNAANWNQAQTVVLAGLSDGIDDGDIDYSVNLTVTADSDTGYRNFVIPSISARNTDIDLGSITVQPGVTTTTEAGGQSSFTVNLDSEPQSSVNIGLSSSDHSEATVSPASLAFDSTNWNLPRTVTITGVDDQIDDGDQSYSITIAPAQSDDPDYSEVDTEDVLMLNQDDDTAGVSISAALPLEIDEAGLTANFSVVLDSLPTQNVSMALSVSDNSEAILSTNSLLFTPTNGTDAQIVIVTGLDDDLLDGDIAFTVVLTTVVTTDPNYIGTNPPDLAVINRDLDLDGDIDGKVDAIDNCPAIYNSNQVDSDFDLTGDVCDDDDDNDLLLDQNDNCPLDSNPAQKDTDGDNDGDACDPDSDNDFVLDIDDLAQFDPRVCQDIDNDGCDDCSIGTDGFGILADATPQNDGPDLDGDFICDVGDDDIDGDNVANAADNCLLVANPDQADADQDGTGDLCVGGVSGIAPEEICWPIKLPSGGIVLHCMQ